MVIISFRPIREYCEAHPKAKNALLSWYEKTEQSDWNTIADVRETFGYADHVGNEGFVFNIKGNNYRLIAAISFKSRTVYVKFIGTHEEYDSIDVLTINDY